MIIPMLIFLQRVVYGTRVGNLTIMIMEALQKCGGLSLESIAKRSICFGADGVSTIQGTKIEVNK
jgi:hypothetical protein